LIFGGWFNNLDTHQILFDNRNQADQGICIQTTGKKTVEIKIKDRHIQAGWDCDVNLLKTNKWHHIAIVVDGGPNVISFLVDGILCDGGEQRPSGYARIPKHLINISGSDTVTIASTLKGKINTLRIYDRYLLSSEAVGNFRAGF
jgi:hypothetical protein